MATPRVQSLDESTDQGRSNASSPHPGNQVSEKSTKTPVSKICIFLVLSLVMLTQAFDATCICVTLPTIASELDASVSESLSLGTAFLLATTVTQPVYSELSHIAGRKPCFLASLVVFIGGTVVCGCAQSCGALLVGRAIQGAGAGGPQALSAVILTDIFAPRQRAKYISLLNISWAVGTIAGPLIGGAFTEAETIGWRWIFWINIPMLLAGVIGAWFLLGYDRPAHGAGLRLLGQVDWVGIFIFTISAVLLLLPLSWGGSRFPWRSLEVILPMVVSAMGFITLAGYESRWAKNPMFRPGIFGNWSTIVQFVNITIHGVLMWMVLYYMSIFYLGVKGYSPLMTGVWALPATLTIAPMAVVVGVAVSRTGNYRWSLLGGWSVMIVAFGVMVLVDDKMAGGALISITIVLGIAMGVLIPAMTVGVQATVAQADAGHAVAIVFVLRSAGQCLGVAVGLSVFLSRLRAELEALGMGKDAAQDAMKAIRHSLEAAAGGIKGTPMMDAVVKALVSVWITGCAMAAVAGVLSACIKCPRLPRDEANAPLRAQTTGSLPRRPGQELNGTDREFGV